MLAGRRGTPRWLNSRAPRYRALEEAELPSSCRTAKKPRAQARGGKPEEASPGRPEEAGTSLLGGTRRAWRSAEVGCARAGQATVYFKSVSGADARGQAVVWAPLRLPDGCRGGYPLPIKRITAQASAGTLQALSRISTTRIDTRASAV